MSLSDIEEVKQIEQESSLGQWSFNDYVEELNRYDSITLVLKLKNQTIGFLIARLITNIPNSLLNSSQISGIEQIKTDNNTVTVNKTEIEIYNIAVKSAFQNCGGGQKLLNYLFAITQGFEKKSFWLEVRKSNAKAIKFYEKNGFRKIYERKNFYSNPAETAVVMRKDLTNF